MVLLTIKPYIRFGWDKCRSSEYVLLVFFGVARERERERERSRLDDIYQDWRLTYVPLGSKSAQAVMNSPRWWEPRMEESRVR